MEFKENKAAWIVVILTYLFFAAVGVMIYFLYIDDTYKFYVENEEIVVELGDTYQLELVPERLSKFEYEDYVYTIESDNIASINEQGIITAKGIGETALKIKHKKSHDVEWVMIKVVELKIPVESIDLDCEDMEMFVGDTKQLAATVNPIDASDKKIKWTSSNKKIVTVDGGYIKGVNEGVATITAISKDDNSKQVSCKIKVIK